MQPALSRGGESSGRPRRLLVRRQLQSVFEGGPAGRRKVALMLLLWVSPIAIVSTASLSAGNRGPAVLIKTAASVVLLVWLLVRPAFRFGEWIGALALLTGMNVAAQIVVGSNHSVPIALNSLALYAMICVAFESRLVLAAAAFLFAGYATVQFHFYGPQEATLATVMYLMVLCVVALVVHGTALYLRDSLRWTGELHAQMEQTAAQERARIAGELHDDTIQVLTAAGLRLETLARRLDRERHGASAESARDVGELIRHALERTRRLTFELYPPQLDQGGLRVAVDALAASLRTDSEIAVTVTGGCERLPLPVEQIAYRTVAELLANVRKHARASLVTITLDCDADALSCVVSDDGRGFDPEAVADAREEFHLGLDVAAERLRSAGGELVVESVPGRGTRASFWLPLAEPVAELAPAGSTAA